MSREEHYIKPSRVTSNKGVYYYNKAVDNCFDEFESRTCENCKHMNKEYKIYSFEKESHTKCEELDTIVNGLDFGCNKWEAKTVSTDTKGEKDD